MFYYPALGAQLTTPITSVPKEPIKIQLMETIRHQVSKIEATIKQAAKYCITDIEYTVIDGFDLAAAQ